MSQTSPSRLPEQVISDLTAIAESLKTTLDALTPFIQSTTIAAAPEVNGALEPEEAAAEQPSQPNRQSGIDYTGEIRSYRVPSFALEDEREYLRHTGADSSFDLMGRVLDRLHLLQLFMRHIRVTQSLPDDFIERIGEQLEDSLDMLQRILSFLEEMKPVNNDESSE